MKKALTTAVLCFVLSVPVFAAMTDFSYSGALDPETGAPLITGEDYAYAQSSPRIALSDTMFYDRDSHSFVYPMSDGVTEITSTAPDGLVTTNSVSLYSDESLPLTLYRNGEPVESPNLTTISDVGDYYVTVNRGGSTETVLRFTIVGAVTNLPGGYTMPDGFYITDATVNDEEAYYDRYHIDMEEDGKYHIEYVAPDAALHMTLDTTVDRTPPAVELNGSLDKNGRFHSTVEVTGLADGDTVVLTRDGQTIPLPYDRRISDTGVYSLQAYDIAGNTVTKQFTILLYFDLNSLVFFALVCLSLLAVSVYVIINRKRLKII